MSNYIKISGEYHEITTIYKKQNGSWGEVSGTLANILGDFIYFYDSRNIDIAASLSIIGESQYTGKSFILSAKYGDRTVYPTWSITAGGTYASINSNGKVTINNGVQNQSITVQATYTNSLNVTSTETKTITISYDNDLSIEGAATMTGTSGNVIARYNGNVVTPTWSITSGNSYASIDLQGNITIIASGTIVVSATYSVYTTTKTIELIYQANTSTETVVDPDTGTTTTTTTTTTQNQDGSTSTSSTTTTTNEDGSSSETVTNTTENQDGSSTSTSTTTNSDGSSSQNETTVNTDGSSTSQTTTQNADGTSQQSQTDTASDGSSATTTTNYNEDGDPTSGTNNTIDTSGNSNTQEITYDENGDTTVTAYTIDTTANESDSGEQFSGNGINTEFVPFDGVSGFEMHIRFYADSADQPRPPVVEDTEDTNWHYNILLAKNPVSPWPGFQIRFTGLPKSGSAANKNLTFGIKVQEANNNNITITRNNNNIYDITVTYDPNLTKYSKKIIARDNINNKNIYSQNNTFSNDELQLTLGYALNMQGQPYRYSVCSIYEFSITKL